MGCRRLEGQAFGLPGLAVRPAASVSSEAWIDVFSRLASCLRGAELDRIQPVLGFPPEKKHCGTLELLRGLQLFIIPLELSTVAGHAISLRTNLLCSFIPEALLCIGPGIKFANWQEH